MTRLLINGVAVRNTSRGGRRYFAGVLKHLAWPDTVQFDEPAVTPRLQRIAELGRRGAKDSIYWTPNQRGPLLAHNHVVTVLDCINIEYTYRNDWRLPLIKGLTQLVLNNAVAITTISVATRNVLLSHYDVPAEKVLAIPGPVILDDTAFSNPGEAASKSERPDPAVSDAPFFLMVLNALPHKNSLNAVRAFIRSRAPATGISLRIVGDVTEQAKAEANAANVPLDIRSNINDATLGAWYRSCIALISPSFSEGLNLPIAEALGEGSEVICSSIPVHREFYNGCVSFFEPNDVDELVTLIDDFILGRAKLAGSWFAAPRPDYAIVANRYCGLFNDIGSGLGQISRVY